MAVTQGKPIDAQYLLEQLKAFESKIIAEKYNVKFQFITMPTADAKYVGQYAQFIGATDTTYTSGFFYKCVEDTSAAGTYVWQAVTQAAPEYSIKKLDTPEAGFAATYELTRDGKSITDAVKINIPKDYFVRDAVVAKVTAADKAAGGKFADDPDFAEGDAYIDLSVNIDGGTAGDVKHVYINVSTLVDVYTAGDGIDITDNEIKINILSTEKGLGLVKEAGAAASDKAKLALIFETVNIDFENDWA